jgi:hypothetical protein
MIVAQELLKNHQCAGSMQVDVDGSHRVYYPNDTSPLKPDVLENASSGFQAIHPGSGAFPPRHQCNL